MFGRSQEICIGYMSGASNVNYWLRQRNIEPSKELVDAILAKAKTTQHNLPDAEILTIVASMPGGAQPGGA
jgi:2-isopropylmalate synthase